MPRWSRLAIVAGVGSLLVAGRGHVGRFLRTVDQRAGVFAPRGASLYNAVAPRILRPLYRRVADDVATLPGLVASPEFKAVLEIGSGPGELGLEIARRLPGTEVVGIDLAEAMIARADERTRAERLDGRVRFVLADAAALPLGDASFDVVVSTLSLHHWAEPATVFAEVARVLRPGGVALIYDLRPFAYLRHELEVFLAGTPFYGSPVVRELVRLSPLPALFVRIRLSKPPEHDR
jgi:ubiquinone/menaquinone biosynthesis C-methylase UbiE